MGISNTLNCCYLVSCILSYSNLFILLCWVPTLSYLKYLDIWYLYMPFFSTYDFIIRGECISKLLKYRSRSRRKGLIDIMQNIEEAVVHKICPVVMNRHSHWMIYLTMMKRSHGKKIVAGEDYIQERPAIPGYIVLRSEDDSTQFLSEKKLKGFSKNDFFWIMGTGLNLRNLI